MYFSIKRVLCTGAFVLFTAFFPLAGANQPDFTTEFMGVRIIDRVQLSDFKKSGNILYYTSMDMESGGLYSIREDGSANERIIAGQVLNVITGDKGIFFTRMQDSGSMGLYRYDAQKKSEEQITSDMFFDTPVYSAGYFYVTIQDRGFFKVSADGKEKVKITEGTLFSPIITTQGIYGWAKSGEEWSLVRIDPVSYKANTILTDTPGFLAASGNTLYFASSYGLFSVNGKTGAKKKLSDDEVNGNFFVVGDRLYFHSYNESRKIMTMKTDGKDRKPLFQEHNNRLLSADEEGVIYYHGDTMSLGGTADTYLGRYFFKKEKNRERLFANMPVQLMAVSNNVMIGTAPSYGEGVFAFYPDRKKAVLLTTDQVIQVVAIDRDTVYYVREYDDSVLCSKSLSGKGEAGILARVSGSAFLAGSRILYINPEDADALYAFDMKSGTARKISGASPFMARGDEKSVYLILSEGQYYSLLQVDLATGKETSLKEGMVIGDIPILVLSGGMLYYTDKGVLFGYDLVKKTETALDNALNGFMFACIATKRYLYFTVDIMGVDGITRLSKDGRQKIKITDGELFGLSFDQGSLYYFRDYVETMPSAEGLPYSYRIRAED